ncbi:MAG TPA: DUF4404 family protein [Ignavibacteriales bacterium]|nr:DUF4404 family protein [Ignavibacteriales bacterium]
MIQDTIEKIEEKIRNNVSLSEENKIELLSLLSQLHPQIMELSRTHNEHAENIAGSIERSANEAMQEEKNPDTLRSEIESLTYSVKDFEVSHPKLVETVNYIATVLANMGI